MSPSLRHAVSLPVAAFALALLTGASEVDVQQCAGVDDPTARLACYDALAGRTATPGAVPAPAVAPAVPAAAPSSDDFGRASPVKSMSARVVGKLNEWRKGTLIKLDNGQVWRVMDERSAFYPDLEENPEIEITRGMLGYTMEIKPIRRKFPVIRIS